MNIYKCVIDSQKQVYDGDTIKDVRIEVEIPSLEVGFWLSRDIRINGIDTPEKRPKRAGRTLESLTAEKAAAREARLFLIELLKANDFQFQIGDIGYGKYAGRVLADVFINGVSVSESMIAAGHAIAYEGGKKVPYEEWSQR